MAPGKAQIKRMCSISKLASVLVRQSFVVRRVFEPYVSAQTRVHNNTRPAMGCEYACVASVVRREFKPFVRHEFNLQCCSAKPQEKTRCAAISPVQHFSFVRQEFELFEQQRV